MANFFKEYQKEVREKKQAKETKKKRTEYKVGQLVYINPIYDIDGNGKRYFVDYLNDGCILLAETKKDALEGYGYIYSTSAIIKK